MTAGVEKKVTKKDIRGSQFKIKTSVWILII